MSRQAWRSSAMPDPVLTLLVLLALVAVVSWPVWRRR